jgi:hypothetical protein
VLKDFDAKGADMKLPLIALMAILASSVAKAKPSTDLEVSKTCYIESIQQPTKLSQIQTVGLLSCFSSAEQALPAIPIAVIVSGVSTEGTKIKIHGIQPNTPSPQAVYGEYVLSPSDKNSEFVATRSSDSAKLLITVENASEIPVGAKINVRSITSMNETAQNVQINIYGANGGCGNCGVVAYPTYPAYSVDECGYDYYCDPCNTCNIVPSYGYGGYGWNGGYGGGYIVRRGYYYGNGGGVIVGGRGGFVAGGRGGFVAGGRGGFVAGGRGGFVAGGRGGFVAGRGGWGRR